MSLAEAVWRHIFNVVAAESDVVSGFRHSVKLVNRKQTPTTARTAR